MGKMVVILVFIVGGLAPVVYLLVSLATGCDVKVSASKWYATKNVLVSGEEKKVSEDLQAAEKSVKWAVAPSPIIPGQEPSDNNRVSDADKEKIGDVDKKILVVVFVTQDLLPGADKGSPEELQGNVRKVLAELITKHRGQVAGPGAILITKKGLVKENNVLAIWDGSASIGDGSGFAKDVCREHAFESDEPSYAFKLGAPDVAELVGSQDKKDFKIVFVWSTRSKLSASKWTPANGVLSRGRVSVFAYGRGQECDWCEESFKCERSDGLRAALEGEIPK